MRLKARRDGRARFNAPDSKSDVPLPVPGVRIPLSPPFSLRINNLREIFERIIPFPGKFRDLPRSMASRDKHRVRYLRRCPRFLSVPVELLKIEIVMEDDRSSSRRGESHHAIGSIYTRWSQTSVRVSPVSSTIPGKNGQLTESAVRMTARPPTSLESITYGRDSRELSSLWANFTDERGAWATGENVMRSILRDLNCFLSGRVQTLSKS